MNEFFNILHDLSTGALPLSELPGFLAWLAAKSFWFWFSLAGAAMFLWAVL
jgi:hypothetical protein